jgi:hypothetical protein
MNSIEPFFFQKFALIIILNEILESSSSSDEKELNETYELAMQVMKW